MRTIVALAAGLGVALGVFAGPAAAQSYKERGYGGPLYVGPNFEQGGQHTPPDYGSKARRKATVERTPAPKRLPPREVAKSRKAPASAPASEEAEAPAPKDTSTTTAVAAPATPDTETDSGGAAAGSDTAASAAPACKRFDSTTGQTFTVPCQ